MTPQAVQFRFYEELNDYLSQDRRKVSFAYELTGMQTVKDAIEDLGVPHTEVDLVLVNGISVGFDYYLSAGDRVSVYPVFESLDIMPLMRLRERPLRDTRFILDVQLGELAGLLRLMGFDVLHGNDYVGDKIIRASLRERRIILTLDRRILMNEAVTRAYQLKSSNPLEQLSEVLDRYDLFRAKEYGGDAPVERAFSRQCPYSPKGISNVSR